MSNYDVTTLLVAVGATGLGLGTILGLLIAGVCGGAR